MLGDMQMTKHRPQWIGDVLMIDLDAIRPSPNHRVLYSEHHSNLYVYVWWVDIRYLVTPEASPSDLPD
jgi:hypothetical protein